VEALYNEVGLTSPTSWEGGAEDDEA
jgi:hypothetical protein